MIQDKVKIGKFFSYILRHAPDQVGIAMDSKGWVAVDELITLAVNNGYLVTREILDDIVKNNPKQRYELSQDGAQIRAVQGHSIEVDVQLTEKIPPEKLYHGTAEQFIDSIFAKGLLPQSRLYVHLSADSQTAIQVGQRHGKPVVLIVNAQQMNQEGIPFYQSKNGVWLVKTVEAKYISRI